MDIEHAERSEASLPSFWTASPGRFLGQSPRCDKKGWLVATKKGLARGDMDGVRDATFLTPLVIS